MASSKDEQKAVNVVARRSCREGHDYVQAGTQMLVKEVVLFCRKCADVKFIDTRKVTR